VIERTHSSARVCLRTGVLATVACCTAISLAAPLRAQPVAVRQVEGQLHGFLVLRTLAGTDIADGELTQASRGNELTSRLVFHFRDGSLQDETTVLSQNGHFRMLSDHLVQKGPAFKRPMDVSINASTGVVTVHYKDDQNRDKTETAHLDLPPDLANGMVPIMLKNLPPGTQATTASLVVATPKPLLVKLVITPEGEDLFSTGSAGRKAIRYDIKVDIGGVRGAVAKWIGKQPPDSHVWVLGGEFPAYLKSEGPAFESGPIWRMELVIPAWPKAPLETSARKK
jgi:hypothetical protein